MAIHLVSTFDINYAARALALYRTAKKNIPGCIFWFLCLDSESKVLLEGLHLEDMKLLTVGELNKPALEALRVTRARAEFAFTAKSNFTSYLLESGKIKDSEVLIWADADIMFFSSIQKILNTALSTYSVAITPHNFLPGKEGTAKKVGRYNAGMVLFRIDQNSRKCITDWANDCITWCYNRYEDGKFADQMYIDYWHEKYSGVYDLPDKGVNLGTWNIGRYTVTRSQPKTFSIDADPLICYHFHGFKMFEGSGGTLKPYPISVYHKDIYAAYSAELESAYAELRILKSNFSAGINPRISLLKRIKQSVQRVLR